MDGKIKLRSFEHIPLAIIDGEPTPEHLQKSGLPKEALGGLWYIADQGFLHGWFYLRNPDSYIAIWDQVRGSSYLECSITFGVRPVRNEDGGDVWETSRPLFIESAFLKFTPRMSRPSVAPPARKSRSWLYPIGVGALCLIGIGAYFALAPTLSFKDFFLLFFALGVYAVYMLYTANERLAALLRQKSDD